MHDFSLRNGEVHIWQAKLALPHGLMREGFPWLSHVEQERSRRFRAPSDRDMFIASHVLLRFILSAYFSQSPGKLQYNSNSYGKPFIAGDENIQRIFFNMSHSGDKALFAISRSWEVGIDVEQVDVNRKWMKLGENIYSPQEKALFEDMPKDRQEEIFYKIWTRKEAYLKAHGVGLDGLNLELSVIDEKPDNGSCTLAQIVLEQHYYGAVAVVGNSPFFRCFRLIVK